MGALADAHCAHMILTNEDPYDESPEKILEEIRSGIKNHVPEVILDRREAIRRALTIAKELSAEAARSGGKEAAVLITGKGTDTYIMGPDGTKMPWDDRDVT